MTTPNGPGDEGQEHGGKPDDVAASARSPTAGTGRLSKLTAALTALRALRAAEAAASPEADLIAAAEVVEHDEKPMLRPFRVGFFGALGVMLAYITYLSVDTIRSTLVVIVVAAVVAIGLEPAVGFFVRRGLRRGWSVLMVFLILIATITGAIYAIIPPIVNEVVTFAQSVPGLIKDLQNNATIKSLDEKFHIFEQVQNSGAIQKIGGGAATGIVTAGVTAAGIAADLFIVLILSSFFLAGFPKIKTAAYRLAPASKRVRVGELGDKILKQMGGYLSGATIVALQAALVAGVFAAIIGLPYPWVIALGAAVLDFVPVIGPVIIGVSMTLLGFTQSLLIGFIAGLFYLIQHMFEAYWLYPRVMRRQVNISTATVVVAILIGGALLGVTGALLAVPVAAAVQLIIREVVVPIQDRS